MALASVVITSQVYHQMLNLDTEDGSLKWFLFDEQAQGSPSGWRSPGRA